MCHVINAAHQAALSRRGMLAGAVGAAAAGGLTGFAPTRAAAAPAHKQPARGRTRLVLLGTAGGPMTWMEKHRGHPTAREGIASAVVVAGRVYVVDCGLGVARQLRLAQLGSEGDFAGFENLQALFLTHLHSDHTMDYFNIPLTGWYHGRVNKPPIEVFGPGPRGALPPVVGDGEVPEVVNPSNPTPGIEDMTAYLVQGFATDINDRMRDSRKPSIHSVIRAHDVMPPAGIVDDPNVNTHPRMRPFTVMEDDYVKVTATLVDHGAVYPAYAYRFDTDDGSVAFSGDTAPSPNLIELARGADILAHEVIDADWVRSLYGEPPYSPEEQAFIQHLLYSHTTIEQVGPVAEEAEVGTLVLTHLAPANNPVHRWRRASAGFSGKLIVGEDLLQLDV